MCAAFRGTYLDYKDKADVVNERNKQEHAQENVSVILIWYLDFPCKIRLPPDVFVESPVRPKGYSYQLFSMVMHKTLLNNNILFSTGKSDSIHQYFANSTIPHLAYGCKPGCKKY